MKNVLYFLKKEKGKQSVKKKKKSWKEIFFFSFYLLFSITFLWISIASFYKRTSLYFKVNPFFTVLCSIIVLFLWIYIYRWCKEKYKDLSLRKQKLFLWGIIILMLSFELLVILKLRVVPGWDFGVIFSQVKSYVLTGDRLSLAGFPEYFQYFPNNSFLFVILSLWFKITEFFGATNFEMSAIVLNILAINTSILFLYLCVRKCAGKGIAFFSLFLCMFFLPLFLYIPIFYTDTLSMPFPIIAVFLYLNIDFAKIRQKKNILLFLLMILLIALGSMLKITCLFILVAILIDLFRKFHILKFLALAMSSIIIVGILSTVTNHLIMENKDYHFQVNSYGKIPYTHWLLMGIEDPEKPPSTRNAYGGYNAKDYDKTLSFETGEKSKNYHINEILRRLKEYGIMGYVDYLTNKAVNAWADGTYFSTVKLSLNPKHPESNLYHFIVNNEYNQVAVIFMNGVQLALLGIFVFSGYSNFRGKKHDFCFLQIAIYGLFVFLLFWENRSRYLVNYIPIYLLLISIFLGSITNSVTKIKIKRFKKRCT